MVPEKMKKSNDFLGIAKYLHREFNMKRILARKGLLSHILEMKSEDDSDADEEVKDIGPLRLPLE